MTASAAARSLHSPRWLRCAVAGLALALIVASLPGCAGCRDDAEDAKKKEQTKLDKKPQKPKPDFERFRFAIQPADPMIVPQAVKPGHWHGATLEAKANNFDFHGGLSTAATDQKGELLDLDRAPFSLDTSRPAVLPKGQQKSLELTLFIPRGRRKTWVANKLQTPRGSGLVKQEMDLVDHMPAYQYYLLVLAREPERYRYLKVLDSIRPPSDEMSGEHTDYFYRVALPNISQRVPLPAHPLAWTAIAYIVWDDIEPGKLRPEQQQAMLDWLYWGGQLIVSGPRSLDALRGSFLEPYLPVALTAGGVQTTELGQVTLHELSEKWTIPALGGNKKGISVAHSWPGVALQRHADAHFIPETGNLLVERNVGRGRIVVSAFRLFHRDLLNWQSFDGFVNACLLRRPARSFHRGNNGLLQMAWANKSEQDDPKLSTRVRYFARDSDDREEKVDAHANSAIDDALNQDGDALAYESQHRANAIKFPGAAGWNDFGPVAEAARQALKQAAGITVPPRDFVLWVLAVYLLVLVPINWLIFWGIGRVEWAWVAAPVIALAFGLVVVRLANLNIGFARAKTEIAVIEMQNGYPRARMARFTALYTSLSTSYDLHYQEPSALAQPFATESEFRMVSGQYRPVVTLRRGPELKLSGMEVASNSTGMVHSEQMLDMGGGGVVWRQLTLPHVINYTRYTLSGAAVVRCNTEGTLPESYWIGKLAPGDDVTVDFAAMDRPTVEKARQGSLFTAAEHTPESVNVRRLVELAQGNERLKRGEVRLVAWLDEELPGVQISPAASQARHAAVVVVHLHRGVEAEPQRDTNSRFDIAATRWEEVDERLEGTMIEKQSP